MDFGDRLDNLNPPALQVDPAGGQSHQLAPRQTCVRQHLDQRPVWGTGLSEGLHLVVGQEALELSDDAWGGTPSATFLIKRPSRTAAVSARDSTRWA